MAHREDNNDDKRRPDVHTRMLRTRDLIDLKLEALGCSIEPVDGGAELVAGPDAVLVVHFPPQHIGEQVLQTMPAPPAPPTGPAQHVAARPSRLAFTLPEGSRIPYTLAAILGALPALDLRVAETATPAGTYVDTREPQPPAEDQTAIEAPYRLVVSPSKRNAFRHDGLPKGPTERPELWRTHLTVRQDDGSFDDSDPQERIVRALWTRDREQPEPLFGQPLSGFDREAIVNQTFGGLKENAETPLMVSRLALSSLGAWFDWKQSWPFPAAVVDYRHEAFMGRDGYVRVAYPGFLFPFGHRAYLVKVTERRIRDRDVPRAYLWQRWFIIVRQPTRTYPGTDRDNPFSQVTVSPLVTPDLDEPGEDESHAHPPFVPSRNGVPYPFVLTTVDRGGQTRVWPAPLVFVQAGSRGQETWLVRPEDAPALYRQVNIIHGRGQTLAVAPPVKAGDTSIEVQHLIFDGEVDARSVSSRPFLTQARAVVPAMRHLMPQAPAVDLAFARPYLDAGLPARAPGAAPAAGHPNAGELVLALTSAPPGVDFTKGSDRSGGFVAPNIAVRGLSRALGTVGVDGAAPSPFDAGTFAPASFLAGAMPKLFGLFNLVEILEPTTGLERAPAFVSDALGALAKLVAEAQRLRSALAAAQARLADEVTHAAHDGARAVAQNAANAVGAKVASLTSHLDALVSAVLALGENPADAADDPARLKAVSDAASALGGDLGPLLTALGTPGIPAAVRAEVAKPTQVLAALAPTAASAAELVKLVKGLTGGQVTSRLRWNPSITPWGLPGVPRIFDPSSPDALVIDVEVRASATAPPAVDILAELAGFDLNLIGAGATGLMKLVFRRVAFHAGSTGKPDVDVVFGGIGFLGPLSFVDRLRSLIPFDGFSDPPRVDVRPDGVTAGFDVALPNVSVGVFSLENIALGADARVPFLGDAMTVGFHFCSKEAPFRLTVMCIGGGGWLGLRAAPKGLVLLELGLEACASLSVDLGVASGSVSISVGVYLRLEGAKGLLTAYFRIRGEVEVLGLVSASITLELALAYQFDTGKLVGRASLVVEVEVLFFSASVNIVVERKLAGSKGDPTMYEVMPPDASGMSDDWSAYCDAFAPIPA